MSSELEFCPRKSGRRAYVRELSSYTRAASSESALNSIFGGTARDAVLFRALMVFIPAFAGWRDNFKRLFRDSANIISMLFRIE
jgi:hypothetical protein